MKRLIKHSNTSKSFTYVSSTNKIYYGYDHADSINNYFKEEYPDLWKKYEDYENGNGDEEAFDEYREKVEDLELNNTLIFGFTKGDGKIYLSTVSDGVSEDYWDRNIDITDDHIKKIQDFFPGQEIIDQNDELR